MERKAGKRQYYGRDGTIEILTRQDLSLGGAHLASTFMKLNLIDEYQLYVHPILLGGGTPLFGATENTVRLELAEARTFSSGVVLLRYQKSQ